MKKEFLKKFLFMFAFLLTAGIYAQNVTGSVDSADGPLPGATILVKGTNNFTTTDFDGNFSVEASQGDVLEVSFVGYTTQDVSVDGDQILITLIIGNELDEIVVTGYGSQTRANVTGSVASVNMGDALKVPVVNAAEALQGRVAGVTVVTNGQPGSAPIVRIRGYGTPNSNNPLYVIDGVQTTDSFVLNSINPSDIDQINVLKDGAAAIYGSRASNGVIIVTTKKGRGDGEPSINFEASYGSQTAVNLPVLLNAKEHGQMIWDSKLNDTPGATPSHPQYGTGSSPVIPSSLLGAGVPTTVNPNGTDWLDAIFQTASAQNYNLSVQNGDKNGSYLLSANYLKRDGIQIHTGYERYGSRLNSEFIINDKITVGQHMNLTLDKQRNGNNVQTALRSSPLIPLRDNNGNFSGIYRTPLGLGNANTPYATLTRAKDDYQKSLRALGDVYLKADLMEGLTFKTSYGGQMRYFNSRGYSPATPEAETGGSQTLSEQNFMQYEWVWSNTLNYSKSFGDHSIDVIAGYEANKIFYKGNQVTRNNYLFETPSYYTLYNGAGTPIVQAANENSTTLASVFASASYNYKDKYLFTGTVRNDRSSRFALDKQDNIFPSVSFGWVIDKEDFFTENPVVQNLKLRLSYGELGNQSLPAANPNTNISSLNENTGYYSFTGARGTFSTGAVLSSVGNPNLSWETSITQNLGLDFRIFKNFTGTIEVWQNETNDLIVQDNSLIGSTAIDAGAPYVNFGDIKNTGVDFTLAYGNETSSGFSYDVALNISSYKNEVTSLINDTPQTGDSGFRGGAVTRVEVGQPLSYFYGREVTGFDTAGRFTYRDVDGSGTVDDADRTFIGSPHPDFTYGLNINLAYNAFDLAVFFNGSQGNEIYNYSKIFTDFPTFFNGNRSVRVLDSWTPSNTGAELPALSESLQNSETQPNSFFVEDGSFTRLKSLQLGYTFSKEKLSQLGMDSVRVYLSGTNLFTITDYDGLDPEASEANALTIGVDSGRYPLPRITSVGLSLNF